MIVYLTDLVGRNLIATNHCTLYIPFNSFGSFFVIRQSSYLISLQNSLVMADPSNEKVCFKVDQKFNDRVALKSYLDKFNADNFCNFVISHAIKQDNRELLHC